MEKFKSRRERAKQKAHVTKSQEASKPAGLRKTVWYKNKKILTIVAIVLMVLFGTLAFWLLSTFSHKVQQTVEFSREQIKEKTNSLDEAENKKVALTQLAGALSPVSCKVSFMPILGKAGDDCKAHNEAVAVYRKNIEKLHELLEYDEYMKRALSKINSKSNVSDYKAEHDRLAEVRDSLNRAPHHERVGKPHVDIMERLAAIIADWDDISEVSSEKNEEKYNETLEKLTHAYAQFQKDASGLMHVYDASQQVANESYKNVIQ